MFQRSEEAPLTLVARLDYPNRPSVVKALLHTYLPRIVDLDITSDVVDLAYGDDLPLTKASKLHHIQLTETRGKLFAYPIYFCSDSAPSLRSVRLLYVKLPWAVSPFMNLVSLSINNLGFFNRRDSDTADPGNAPTLSQILHILKSNEKTLEVLELVQCLPIYTPPFPTMNDSVMPKFSRLRDFVLNTYYHTALAVFTHISIPTRTRLQLHLTVGASSNQSVPSSYQLAWFARSRRFILTPSRTLEVTVEGFELITRFWLEEIVDEDIQSSQFTPNSKEVSQFKFDRTMLHRILPDTIKWVLSHGLGTTPHITTLTFRSTSEWLTDDWLVAFGSLRTLRNLSVSGNVAVRLISLLSTRHDNPDPEAISTDDVQPESCITQSPHFNRLSHLALSLVDFGAPLILKVNGPKEPYETTLLNDVIITELHQRRREELDDSNSISRIRWLSIQRCTIQETWGQNSGRRCEESLRDRDESVVEKTLVSSMLAHSDQTSLNFWSAAGDARLLIARKNAVEPSQEQGRLDDELDALQLVLERIRVRRNQLMLAIQLPEDVIFEVFRILAQSDPPSQRHIGWIAVSHVCHRWREIALQHSLLWTYISTDSGSRLMELMLQRSEEAPLTMIGRLGYPKRTSLVKALLQTYLPRIVDLDITSDIVQLAYGNDSFLPSRPSMLRRIELSETPGGLLAYPIHFCSDRAPSLRSVRLEYVKLPWAVSLFTNLVSLSINNSGFFNEWESNLTDPGNTPTLSQILHILRPNEQTLEVLELAGCLPLYTPPFPAMDDNAMPKFARLREFVLETNYHTALAVFTHISFPTRARLQLHLTGGVFGHFDYVVSSYQLAWFARSRRATLTPSRTLEVTEDPYALITRFWSEELVDEDIQFSKFIPDSKELSHLEFDRGILYSSLPNTIQWVLSLGLGRTPQLTTLSFKLSSIKSAWSADDWLVAFGSLRTLRHLSVAGTAAVSLICVLSTPHDNLNPEAMNTDDSVQPASHTAQSPHFNRLSHLALSFVDFGTSIIMMADSSEPYETTLLDIFVTELYERRRRELDDNSASRIRWLSIQSCTLQERWWEKITLVEHIHLFD
ncbi:uncharacterized protein STEHIDRAFT_161412 [Stereum hirsutum FP-91666 SS1]|uniref:uncharacterized protein n=1 Tax=Stereum hirsutum (strain FP-91666) TaxID=721885 RepID=UPI000444A89A|nr:uncharacterized protein STEHIDRAFT_161412 [Stereum hirsutum FP-91666 SS1]EIM82060.1 hypothetical protein STEHIDRAFT_161412 [Stereum hirsutum FP-91666 SS1]